MLFDDIDAKIADLVFLVHILHAWLYFSYIQWYL